MHEWVRAAREGLADVADPAAAEPMRAYMKSEMPFRGVPKPARERLLRTLVAAHPLDDADELLAVADTLWTGAAYREERYLAIALLGHRRYASWARPGWVPVHRRWIVSGGWWDFTDEIANRHIAPLLRAHRGELTPVVRGWISDPDRWLRRTSVICQLQSGAQTDLDLLRDAIEANQHDPDFFLRKGIGWALRQYARVDAGWVRAFVDEHPDLSPLSRREALKHIG
ncbi:DNA alkylation repair protein [Pseudonocardia humida]|uniref:DNA alkylation repair protein n=1 Tax=Pseudonocardia humida TaxID=2800819 RepID=A0ABT1A4I7_9PSEU|nr:DNA alkylation repair protein [Pseudonocardia humida]MCO1657861.1 DNA alkylation repair protein [Pseudonocardia humida]